ncbi:cyclin-dependent kinase inhibitor 1C [Anas platyrhynchos]
MEGAGRRAAVGGRGGGGGAAANRGGLLAGQRRAANGCFARPRGERGLKARRPGEGAQRRGDRAAGRDATGRAARRSGGGPPRSQPATHPPLHAPMADVHLSGPPALERLAARRALLAGHDRSAVCRSLFGPVDHEELGRELRSRLREMGEADQRRWDYNFHTDTPLPPAPGRLRWEEVEGSAVPAFYRETLQVGRRRVPLRRAPPAPSPPAAGKGASGASGGRLSRENRAAPPAPRRRAVRRSSPATRITDFFARRKRPAQPKAAAEHPPGCASPPAAVPAEQTPRKRLR